MEFDNAEVDFDIEEAKSELIEQMGFSNESDDDETATDEGVEHENEMEMGAEEDSENNMDDQASEISEPPQLEIRQAPQSWAKDQHETWSKLPKEAQDYIELREKQMLDGLEQYKEGHNFANEMRQSIEPFREMLNGFGVDDKTAVTNLLGWNQVLTNGTQEQRQNAFISLGQDLGIIPREGQKEVDPYVQQLEQRLNQIENSEQQRQQAIYQSEYQKNAKVVEDFAKNHEHFEAVQNEILPFINAGMTLEEAYERAVWANPVTRALEQEKATQAMIEKRRTEAEKAAKNKAVNIRSAKQSSSGGKGETIDDTLSSAYDRIVAG